MTTLPEADVLTTLEQLLQPKHTALIVYDMQVGIVPQIVGGDTILQRTRVLLDAARLAGIR